MCNIIRMLSISFGWIKEKGKRRQIKSCIKVERKFLRFKWHNIAYWSGCVELQSFFESLHLAWLLFIFQQGKCSSMRFTFIISSIDWLWVGTETRNYWMACNAVVSYTKFVRLHLNGIGEANKSSLLLLLSLYALIRKIVQQFKLFFPRKRKKATLPYHAMQSYTIPFLCIRINSIHYHRHDKRRLLYFHIQFVSPTTSVVACHCELWAIQHFNFDKCHCHC